MSGQSTPSDWTADSLDVLTPIERRFLGRMVSQLLRHGTWTEEQRQNIGPEATTFLACARAYKVCAFVVGLVATALLVALNGRVAAMPYGLVAVLMTCSFGRIWSAHRAKKQFLRESELPQM